MQGAYQQGLPKIETEALVACGVAGSEASALRDRIAACMTAGGPAEVWWRLVNDVLCDGVPFAVHELLYEKLSASPALAGAPLPAWQPPLPSQRDTFIDRVLADCDLDDYAALHAWSVEDRESFYAYMLARLEICFRRPPDGVVDLSDRFQSPRWLPGARYNIVDSCFNAAADAPAIVFRRGPNGPLQRWCYQELSDMSRRVANALPKAGFKPGDAIAIAMTMSPESVAIYLGIVAAGCVVISIADSFSPAEIATRLRIGHAKGIFTCDVIPRGNKALPMYTKVVEAGAPRAIVLTKQETASISLREGDLRWQDFLVETTAFDALPRDPHDTINILFSSGTTGDPKAIPWNHTTPLRCGIDGRIHQNIVPGTVVAWPTNLGWMMGPWLIFATLLNQGTIALYDDTPTGRDFCQFVADAEVQVLGVVPSLVRAWRAQAAAEGLDWSAIRCFSSTGECSNTSDMLYLMALADYKPVIEYCGGTEIGGAYLTGTLVQPAAPATFTTPSVGLDLLILDEEGEPADHGEVFLVPPALGLSLDLLNRDHHAVYFADTPSIPGYPALRRHGDQLQRLPGGFYRALGRADDTMNLGGIKTSSAEIERTLKLVEGVVETAAVATTPPEGGPSQLVIYAVVDGDYAVDALKQDMQQAIRGALNPLFKIHELCLVATLPRTASGKVMRRLLRSRYETVAD